jgi:hypothetical protein
LPSEALNKPKLLKMVEKYISSSSQILSEFETKMRKIVKNLQKISSASEDFQRFTEIIAAKQPLKILDFAFNKIIYL